MCACTSSLEQKAPVFLGETSASVCKPNLYYDVLVYAPTLLKNKATYVQQIFR